MKLCLQNTALLLIDLQKGFDDAAYWGGNRNNKDAEEKAALLLKNWRAYNLPIFHIFHSSQDTLSRLHETHPGFAVKESVAPIDSETVLIKKVNSAFIGTGLQKQLEDRKIHKIVLVGLTTNHCISTTARMAGNLGFETLLVSDATATFDRKGINGEIFPAELIHQTALASLHEEFVEVVDTKEVLNRL